MPVGWNLQDQFLEAHAVIGTHCALVLLTQDVFQTTADPEHEGRACLRCRLCKLGIECRQIDFGEILVGLRHAGDTGQCQFLRQTPLMPYQRPVLIFRVPQAAITACTPWKLLAVPSSLVKNIE